MPNSQPRPRLPSLDGQGHWERRKRTRSSPAGPASTTSLPNGGTTHAHKYASPGSPAEDEESFSPTLSATTLYERPSDVSPVSPLRSLWRDGEGDGDGDGHTSADGDGDTTTKIILQEGVYKLVEVPKKHIVVPVGDGPTSKRIVEHGVDKIVEVPSRVE